MIAEIGRLHSSLGYMRPVDCYRGNPEEKKKHSDERLAIAKQRRMPLKREFNRELKLAQVDLKHGLEQITSYFKTSFCPILRKQDRR